jgi:amidohydrolase
MKEQLQQLSEKYFMQVLATRRLLHARPELAYEEFETAALVAKILNELGFEVTANIAKTGVVALLKCRDAGSRCVALRADMDALPITEQNETDYKSKVPGQMHACGHDVHTASLLGVAMILSELRSSLTGTYKFIFQPSEEKIPSGAEAMIKEGVLHNPAPDVILGLHVSPEIEAGKFGFCAGEFMASSDELYLKVKGKGGHAAQRHLLHNPLLIASHILIALEKLNDERAPVVISFGKIEGLGATNIVPDEVTIQGTLRCFNEALRREVQGKILSVCNTVAEDHNGACEVNILRGYPVLINNEQITEALKSKAKDFAGADNVLDIPHRLGSEDFAYYTHHVPACFYRLGVGNVAKGITSGLHTPTFDIDEIALKYSIGMMAWLAINFQKKQH